MTMNDHDRGCEGRNYTCTCGFDDARDTEIERLRAIALDMQDGYIEAAERAEESVKAANALQIEVDRLRQMVARLREWQPIETAPKDGTPIIGAFFDVPWADSHMRGDIVKCWYQPEFEAFISSCREMSLASGYFFEDGSSRQLHSPTIEKVSHWMTLPEPPK